MVEAPLTLPREEREIFLRWRRLRRNRVTLAGFAIIAVVVICALFAPLIAPYPPLQGNATETLQPPSLSHLFGTDSIGFDVFSRVIYGARIDLVIAVGAVAIALVVGCTLGAVSGFLGRVVDEVVMRVMDMLSAFPSFILALGVVAALGPSLPNLIFAIAFVNVPVYARLLRARVLTVRETQVFALVVTGMLNKQIANDLGVGLKTIKAHRARVMGKMRAASVAELVRLADGAGVIMPGPS